MNGPYGCLVSLLLVCLIKLHSLELGQQKAPDEAFACQGLYKKLNVENNDYYS